MVSKAVKLLMFASLLIGGVGRLTCLHAEEAAPKKSEGGGGKSTNKKETNINFEDELVEGELKKPELFYLLQKKQFNFKRLIKLRDDFLPEMRRDADEIHRGKSK